MAISSDTIDHVTLQHLVEAGAVRGADVVGQPGGWGIVIKYGMTERALAARRGALRIFIRFETLVNYLKSIGILQFNVNASNYDSSDKRSRPLSLIALCSVISSSRRFGSSLVSSRIAFTCSTRSVC